MTSAFLSIKMDDKSALGTLKMHRRGPCVRLPKMIDDPAREAMSVPDSVTLADFLAAGNLWR